MARDNGVIPAVQRELLKTHFGNFLWRRHVFFPSKISLCCLPNPASATWAGSHGGADLQHLPDCLRHSGEICGKLADTLNEDIRCIYSNKLTVYVRTTNCIPKPDLELYSHAVCLILNCISRRPAWSGTVFSSCLPDLELYFQAVCLILKCVSRLPAWPGTEFPSSLPDLEFFQAACLVLNCTVSQTV
jgi:hypothetical protein